jgi:hypothetical protein
VNEPPVAEDLLIVAGNDQRISRGSAAAPLRVRVLGVDDQPLPGATVHWSLAQGQATLDPLQSTTDASGEAETRVTTGGTAGSLVVNASVDDVAPVSFSITTVEPAQLRIVSGNGQRAAKGSSLRSPLRVQVVASDDEPLAGAVIHWSVSQGQAALEPSQSTTDASGETETRVILGPATGSISVSATVEALAPATFSITALEPSAFVSVSAGTAHTCGVLATGDAYCWGRNIFGELGDGTTTDKASPVLVLGGLKFATVSAGDDYTCGVTVDATAYCWGENGYGRLGDGTAIDRTAPVPVAGALSFALVTAGDPHTCGLTTAGAAYCWGQNGAGQLGVGTTTGPETCAPATCSTVPVPVAGGLSFTDVGLGRTTTCGVTTGGLAYCWGSNFDGQLGIGTNMGPEACGGSQCSTVPVQVSGGLTFRFVTGGGRSSHICGVTTAGNPFCWGANTYGQLGAGTTTGPENCGVRMCSTVPVPVTGGLSFSSLSEGDDYTCALTATGGAYCWGLSVGQLGIGPPSGPDVCQSGPCTTVPMPVTGGLSFGTITGGSGHTCGVTVEGTAYCWGLNETGQLGDGTTTQRLTPVLVTIGG